MDLTSLFSDAGLNVETLTLNVVLRGALILLVGMLLIRFLLALIDRALARSKSFSSSGKTS